MALIIPPDVGGPLAPVRRRQATLPAPAAPTGATVPSPPVSAPLAVPPQAAPTVPAPLAIPPEVSGGITGQVDVPLSPFPLQPGETRAAQDLPELGTAGLLGGEDAAKTAAVAATILVTPNEQEVADILTTNFPNVGVTQDPGGNLLATNNRTGVQVILNKPGVSRIDLLRTLGIVAAFTPAAGAAAALTGTAARIGGGAALAGLTQTGIEVIQEQLGGELNQEEVAFAAALGGAAEAVVPAIQALRASRQARALEVSRGEVQETLARVAPARGAQAGVEAATGIRVPIFPGQLTQVPVTLLKQRLVAQLDAGAKRAIAALEDQNQAAFAASLELINSIAPARVAATGAIRFREASKIALDAKKQSRAQAVRPLFKEALEVGASVDLKPVDDLIAGILQDAPEGGKLVGAMAKIQNLIRPGEKGREVLQETALVRAAKPVSPSLKRLQKAKFELDNMLENFGENALGTTTKREVVGVKKALVQQMEQASPLYAEANRKFAELSPAVTDLENSILGVVSKISDVNLKSISKRIFDASESNPNVIRLAKNTIDEVDPGAFDDLLRVEFQRRIGGITTLAEDLPGELVANAPGQLRRAIFGNPIQRQTLLSGMTTEQRKNFVYLDEVLRRASTGRAAGSPTIPFKEALEKLRGVGFVLADGLTSVVRDPAGLAKGIGRVVARFGGSKSFDDNVAKLTDVLFNPKWEPKLKELRKLDPTSKRAETIFRELLTAAKAAPQVAQAPGDTGG